MKIDCSVIIPAAGSGTRMNSDVKKQFILLNNKPVLIHTLEKFDESNFIKKIIVVTNKEDVLYCKELIGRYKWSKNISVVEGGNTRQESVEKGLNAVDAEQDVVLIHDGARPFINLECIEKCIKVALKSGAAVVGVKVKDTIKETDEKNNIINTPDRSKLWAVQTPQAFRYNTIKQAHETAILKQYIGTDDSVLVEKFTNIKVKMIEGLYSNIKITTKEDLIYANYLMKHKKKPSNA